MCLQLKILHLGLVVVILIYFAPALKAQHKAGRKALPGGTPVLWREPTDITSRDLYLGPGGESMKPDLTKVTFVENVTRGYSKRFRVRDGSGRQWIAKMGKEAQPETAAIRIVSAAGYFTDATYLAPSVEIEGKGTFSNVEFKARSKEIERVDHWDWQKNPFVGTRELQGLKILMVLLNNWDLKTSNNRILAVRDDESPSMELRYIVSDLGATFGKTGGVISHNRNEPNDYIKTKFVTGVRKGIVQFAYHGKESAILRDITVDQAQWLGNILTRLGDEQLRDAFRAANYSPEEVQMLTSGVRSRINELFNVREIAGRRWGVP